MTLGDAGLEREVLAMFSAQAVGLIGALAAVAAGRAGALAHTLKGSARAIGAFRVADAADRLEAAIRNGDDPAEALAGLEGRRRRGARRHRRDPAPVLILEPLETRRRTAPQVFAPTAGAERIDPL